VEGFRKVMLEIITGEEDRQRFDCATQAKH